MVCIVNLIYLFVMYDILELNTKYIIELREIAQSIGIERAGIMKKPDLIFMILDQQPVQMVTSNLNQILSFS